MKSSHCAADSSTASERQALAQRLLEAAVEYLSRGWPVVPVHGKKPLIRWQGYQQRFPTDEEVRSWPWDRATGLALVCGCISGIVVVDEDMPRAADALGELPDTVEARTGKGGRHFYFRIPDGLCLPPRVRTVCPGVDIRAEGSVIVVPPSLHPANGRAYEWVRSPDAVKMAELPQRVCESILQAGGPARATGEAEPQTGDCERAADREPRPIRSEKVLRVLSDPGEYPSRSEACWFIVNTLLEEGWSRAEIASILLGSVPGSHYRRPRLGRAQQLNLVLRDIDRAVAKKTANEKVVNQEKSGISDFVHTPSGYLLVGIPISGIEGIGDGLRPHPECGRIAVHLGKGRITKIHRGLSCKCLSCKKCGPRWRRAQLERAVRYIDPERRRGHDQLYLHFVDDERAYHGLTTQLTRKTQNELKAAEADPTASVPGWMAIRMSSGRVAVLSSKPHRQRGRPAPVVLSALQATVFIARMLARIWNKDDRQFSHSWPPPPRIPTGLRRILVHNDVQTPGIVRRMRESGVIEKDGAFIWPRGMTPTEIDSTLRRIEREVEEKLIALDGWRLPHDAIEVD